MHGQKTNSAHVGQHAGEANLRALVLATKRELQAPLRALRTLLEGRRGSESALTERAFVDRGFIDRALDELLRTERAAENLVHWTCPRELRMVPCTVAEIVGSLSSALDGRDRSRCHFVVEDESTDIETDGPLLVDAFARTIREILAGTSDPSSEVMVHAHADDERVTISIVDGPAVPDDGFERDQGDRKATLAETLLERDAAALGGRVTIHRTGDHRCCIAILPRRANTSQPRLDEYGGAA